MPSYNTRLVRDHPQRLEADCVRSDHPVFWPDGSCYCTGPGEDPPALRRWFRVRRDY